MAIVAIESVVLNVALNTIASFTI